MRNYRLPMILRGALVALISFIFAACSGGPKYRIGVSQCSDDDWRSKMNQEIMLEAMLHDDVEVEIRSANDDSGRQIEDLDYFVNNGFDIIIVAPNEADALIPKIKDIYDSGKPVILFDRSINGNSYTAFQGADNEAIGEMAATVAAQIVSGAPRVLEIWGLRGSTPAERRHNGFANVADSLGINVLASGDGNWNYDEALVAADSLLELYPDVNVVYAHNDRMAIAARDACDARGLNDVKIIGIDAAPAIGIQAVKDGKIDATFLYPTYGNQLIKTALDILEGRPYERLALLPTPAPVDASNAEMLLLQDQALKDETAKIGYLQGKVDTFSQRVATQSTMLLGALAILALLAGLIFMLLKWYWSGKRHRAEIEARNADLARQRDELDNLYSQLQEATGSKLTWFTNVSHDLRTPLTLIADPVHQLAQADNLTPQQSALMQLADKNVKRLERLVNQILDIRKYDNEQLKLNLVNIEVGKMMMEWTAAFAELVRKKHIKFSATYLPEDDTIIAVDIEKAERVLFNLLSNAFKFTPENGTISITLDRVGDTIVGKVSDTGVGIPPEEIDNIFNRFFRTDRINPNGSGIGLALTKVFVEMHGGSISVESNVGSGTTFTITVPIRTIEGEVAQTSNAPVARDVEELVNIEEDENIEIDGDAPTILVIDDNPDICALVRSILSGQYTVICAGSGPQGIRLATKYLPDLIICDVMMPGTDGYEVCRELKRETLTCHIPVLLLTACSRDEQRIEGYGCGADAYMSKPFDSAMLAARCRSLIDNRQLIYSNLDAKPQTPANGAPADKGEKGVKSEVTDEFLQRFLDIIDENIANADLSVEDIAARFGISRVQLYRKVKAVTNYSVAEMVRNQRLKRAASMLKTTQATVSEIAYAVGFSSPSYFSRAYKDYYGEAPLDTQRRTSKR